MTRGDRVLFVCSALSLLGAACLFLFGGSKSSSSSRLRSYPTEKVEDTIGSPEFLTLFSPDQIHDRELKYEIPRDPASVTGSDSKSAKKTGGGRLGDLPIPDVVGGVAWKTCPLMYLLKVLGESRETVEGLELHLMMRAVVARLRSEPSDLETAIAIASNGPDSEERRLLIIALGRLAKGRAEEVLVRLAREADVRTRESAILSLAQCGAEPDLDGSVDSPDWPRFIAAEPANHLKGPGAQILPDLLATEKDPSVLVALIAMLGDSQSEARSTTKARQEVDGERVTKLIVSYAVTAPDVEVRRAAVSALQHTKAADAINALIKVVTDDTDASTRALAASSLSATAESDNVFQALVRAASSDSDVVVRRTAAFSLAPSSCGTRGRDAEEISIKLYRQERSSEVRRMWVCIFGTMGEAGKVYLQEAYTQDADPAIKEYAGQLLKKPE